MDIRNLKKIMRKIETLKPYERNIKDHPPDQVAEIAASIEEFGWTIPVLIDPDGEVIAGHGRLLAAEELGIKKIPCLIAEGWSEAQKRAYRIADNKLTENGEWNAERLSLELQEIGQLGLDLSLTGFRPAELDTIFGNTDISSPEPKISLADKFLIPPFSILNAREGWWQDRKRAWMALGIKSELGRGENAAPGGSIMVALNGHTEDGKRLTGKAKSYNTTDWLKEKGLSDGAQDVADGSGTSVFDPVLTELAYLWFSPPGGKILDPFAGGSVRGIVAEKLGRKYFGHELRAEQVAANIAQADEICGPDYRPEWAIGDSRKIDEAFPDLAADLVFSCPPYAFLEVYSDDPADLSAMTYDEFLPAYREIIAKSCKLLRKNRFAAFVVGEVRGKDANGAYLNFVGDTVEAFRAAGLDFYNEAILVTSVGSLPIRAEKQFRNSRKLGKSHQNVLIFVKGSAKEAAKECGEIELKFEAPDDHSQR